MLTCRDAARLFTEAPERRLSRGERLSLWLHLAICASCRRVRAQVRMIRDMILSDVALDEPDLRPETVMPADTRQRIAAALRREDDREP